MRNGREQVGALAVGDWGWQSDAMVIGLGVIAFVQS